MKRLLALALLPLVAAAGRVDDTDLALTALRAEDVRVATVAHRLATANRALCPRLSPWFGLVVHELRQYAPRYRPAVARFFAMGDGPSIEGVVPGSPADRAGARGGDRIVAINGIPVTIRPPSRGGKADYGGVEDVIARLEAGSRVGPVTLTVERGGERLDLVIVPEQGCRSQVQLDTAKTFNAAADGTMISIELGAAAEARNDDELAVSIAHEMAHNILDHRMRLDRAGIERDRRARTSADAREIRRTEDEADLLGLYLVANAGFDVDVAPPYWERLSGAGDATHAGSAERRALTQSIVDGIKAKRAKGEPLTPPIAIPAY